MPRYQKPIRFATPHFIRLSLGILLLWAGLIAYAPALGATPSRTQTSYLLYPQIQAQSSDFALLYLLPVTETSVRLLTHTVDVGVRIEGDQTLLSVEAGYRLHNNSTQSQTLVLQVIASPNPPTAALPNSLALSVGGQPLALQSANGGYPQTTQVTLGADSRQLITLTYETRVTAADLATFRYTPQLLDVWAGRPESWRVTIQLPGENSGILPVESWLATMPDSWTYNGEQLQWLQDGSFPEEPFTFQWVTPFVWNKLAETSEQLRTQPDIDHFLALGNLYSRLYRSPQTSVSVRQRLYAQALGAYADGIAYGQQVGISSAGLAPLHTALASLYRSRSVRGDGQVDSAYVDLMVEEVQNALTRLPADAPQRGELNQWLRQGLDLQFRQAQDQANWPRAAQILQQMTTLPGIDPAQVAAQQQTIELQQALSLLNQGNQDAAIALAGAAVLDESLLPPPENRAVFASWQVTLTLSSDGASVVFVASPVEGREKTARSVTDQLIQSWQNASITGYDISTLADARLIVRLPMETLSSQRLAIVQSIPALPDWALLRTLITLLDPTIVQSHQWVWRRVEIAQTIDLRAVSDQWRGVAALMERQAADVESAATPGNSQIQSPDLLQNEIRSQLRQIYLEREAALWQNAARSSTLRVQVEVNEPGVPDRVWLIQLLEAAQTLTFETEVLNPARLLTAALSILIGILLVAGLLWLLL